MTPAFAAALLRRGKRLRSYAATARQARRIFQSRVFTTAAAVMIGGSATVLACPVCFGAEETSMIDGARLGVLVMLAILFAVQGGFVGFFLYLRKRAKRIADIELDTEWSELQGASRTS
jgi:MFS-type transporter involved in bile tolerance (Atg22 family)